MTIDFQAIWSTVDSIVWFLISAWVLYTLSSLAWALVRLIETKAALTEIQKQDLQESMLVRKP